MAAVLFTVTEATPEVASVTVPTTVTVRLLRFALAAGEVMATTGARVSIVTLLVTGVLVVPARFVAVTLIRNAPSALAVT